MNHNWGECFFDHYEKFLGNLSGRRVYESGSETHSIQVLEYEGVFRNCLVFASMGLSHYSSVLGQTCEVVVPADGARERIATIVANTLFHIINQRLAFGSGIAVGGIEEVCPEFSREYDKHALYFTQPYGFPDGFESPMWQGKTGHVYLGIFIARSEFDFFKKVGADKFELLLQNREVDPYNVARLAAI